MGKGKGKAKATAADSDDEEEEEIEEKVVSAKGWELLEWLLDLWEKDQQECVNGDESDESGCSAITRAARQLERVWWAISLNKQASARTRGCCWTSFAVAGRSRSTMLRRLWRWFGAHTASRDAPSRRFRPAGAPPSRGFCHL